MKTFQLTEADRRYCLAIGLTEPEIPATVNLSDEEYSEILQRCANSFPNATKEKLHEKVIGHIIWRRERKSSHAMQVNQEKPSLSPSPPAPIPAKGKNATSQIEWASLIIKALILLTLWVMAARSANAQFSKINSIEVQQAGALIGYFASPFIVNCTGSLACSVVDSTWTMTTTASPLTTKGDIFTYTTLDARLPVGANGLVLGANSATATGLEWIVNGAGAAHNLFSATHSDTVSASPVRGDLIIANLTPAWTKLALGAATAGKYAKSDGSDVVISTGSASGVGACAASNWISTLNADAAPTCTQPAASDLSNGTSGSGAVALVGSPTFTTSALSPIFSTTTADPADTGILRLANGETICWEASPPGTDFCITGDSSERIAATTFVGALTGNADTATTATTANAGDSATSFFSSGTLEVAVGGTGTSSTLTGLVRGSATAMTAAELSGDATTSGSNVVTVKDNLKISTLGITIDGGGSAITTGIKGYLEVPFACAINRATTLADQSGSVVIDVWKDTYANYPPTVANTITASAKPTISAATKAQDSTLTGWTTSVTAGDILGFKVDSATTVTRVHLSLKCTRT